MEKIYSSQCLKQAESNYNGTLLMERAALGIISVIEKYIKRKPLTILCGSGNNGGDGWAVASMLKNDVTVIYTKEPKTEESKYYRNKYFGKALSIEDESAFDIISSSEFILDCIFGIGLNSAATGIYEKVFNAVNDSNAFVISVDVPSGIPSDSFEVFPHIRADITVSITSKKLSGVVSPTKYDFGEIYTVPIGVDMSSQKPIAICTDEDVFDFLPKRPEYSNKGTFGTLKTLCGSVDMPGAGFLAITAALRTGVGLVKAFGDNKLLDVYKNRISEPIFKCFNKDSFIEEKSTAALIGCGIANVYDDSLREIFTKTNCPMVIDADGINFLSRNIDICEHIPFETVITPHPGEMARLCNCSVAEVEKNRFEICETVSQKLNCTVVLKGNGTIISSPNKTTVINNFGNSGLAKGGSGDVLAGIIASFLSQGLTAHRSAVLGVYFHSVAADSLKRKYSEFSFLPSDIPLEIGKIIAEKNNSFWDATII